MKIEKANIKQNSVNLIFETIILSCTPESKNENYTNYEVLMIDITGLKCLSVKTLNKLRWNDTKYQY